VEPFIVSMRAKATTLVFILVVLLFVLVACSSSAPDFPDDFRNETIGIYEDILLMPINVDFYIQAAPSMKGFVLGGRDVYAHVIELLEAPLTQWLANNRSVSYYRFDVPGIDTRSNWPFYRIERNHFFSDSLSESFYSLGWILDSAAYGGIYQNLHGTKTSIDIFREPYIESTLRGLKSDHLSVIVTDLLDFSMGTGIASSLSERINGGCSVAIFVLESAFVGEHQVPGTNMNATGMGIRPFYILVLGSREHVSIYTSQLETRLSDRGIANETLYLIQGSPVVTVNSGLTEVGDLLRMERIIGEDLRNIVGEHDAIHDVFIYHLLRGRNNGQISFDLSLALDVDMRVNAAATSGVSLGDSENPLSGGQFSVSFSLEGLEFSSNEESDNVGVYNRLGDVNSYLRLNDIRESGFTFRENSDVATLTITIDNDSLRRTHGRISERYRLTVDLSYIQNTIEKPSWVHRHNGTISDLSNSRTPNLDAIITDIINAADRNRERNRLVARTRLFLILR
jgi:hypothetical protein